MVEVVNESRKLLRKTMIEQGIPGAVVCVYVNGREVWNEGIGYADVENDVICSPHSVMRIASISKCLTAVAAMQLWEDGLLDLDAPIQTYVPQFPYKTFNGKKVNITCRQILCHMAGIRHYSKASGMTITAVPLCSHAILLYSPCVALVITLITAKFALYVLVIVRKSSYVRYNGMRPATSAIISRTA